MKNNVIILLLLTSFFSCLQCKETGIDSGRFTFLVGSVSLNGVVAGMDDRIKPGDVITTADKSAAVIRFGNISLLSLKNNTTLTIDTLFFEKRTVHILQETGKTFNKIMRNTDYRITTPTLIAAVRGTSFSLSIEKDTGKTRIGVLSGIVVVNKAKGAGDKRIRIENDLEVVGGFGVDIVPDIPVVPKPLGQEEKAELAVIEKIDFIDDAAKQMKNPEPQSRDTEKVSPDNEARGHGTTSEKKVKTYDEILKEIKIKNHGKLDIIRLKNGRQIVGMIVERGLMFKIQTPRGMISVTRDEIDSQTISY